MNVALVCLLSHTLQHNDKVRSQTIKYYGYDIDIPTDIWAVGRLKTTEHMVKFCKVRVRVSGYAARP